MAALKRFIFMEYKFVSAVDFFFLTELANDCFSYPIYPYKREKLLFQYQYFVSHFLSVDTSIFSSWNKRTIVLSIYLLENAICMQCALNIYDVYVCKCVFVNEGRACNEQVIDSFLFHMEYLVFNDMLIIWGILQ